MLEIKDIKYNKVPWTETVIKLNICQKWGKGAKTSIFFLTNEQLNYKLHVQCWYCHNLLKDRTLLESRNTIYHIIIRIECILLKFHWGMKALTEVHFQWSALALHVENVVRSTLSYPNETSKECIQFLNESTLSWLDTITRSDNTHYWCNYCSKK